MKRLFCSVILSLMSLFVIWTIIAYINYGSNMVNYRLNLEATVRKLDLLFGSSDYEPFSLLRTFRIFVKNIQDLNKFSITAKLFEMISGNSVMTISSGFGLLLNAIEALFNPIATIGNMLIVLVYIPVVLIQLVGTCATFIMGLVEFVVSPVFTPI